MWQFKTNLVGHGPIRHGQVGRTSHFDDLKIIGKRAMHLFKFNQIDVINCFFHSIFDLDIIWIGQFRWAGGQSAIEVQTQHRVEIKDITLPTP